MSEPSSGASFPRMPLYGAAALLGLALLMVGTSRVTGIGASKIADATTVIERELRFEDRADGGISIYDARAGLLIDSVAPGTNGFLRGTLRGMARERKRRNVGQTEPFHLSARSDGHLMLNDPATGRFVDLGSFGPTNAAVFAKLLTVKPADTASGTAQNPT